MVARTPINARSQRSLFIWEIKASVGMTMMKLWTPRALISSGVSLRRGPKPRRGGSPGLVEFVEDSVLVEVPSGFGVTAATGASVGISPGGGGPLVAAVWVEKSLVAPTTRVIPGA